MQLLRDNLTLWTSSDGGEAEPPAAAAGESAKEPEKAAEPSGETHAHAAPSSAVAEPATEAPATTAE